MIVATIVLVSALAILGSAWSSFTREVDARRDLLIGVGSAYSAVVSKPVAEQNASSVNRVLRGLTEVPGVVQADVRLEDGTRLSQLGGGALLLGRDGDPSAMSHLGVWNAQQLHVSVPVRHNGRKVGQLTMLADVSDLRSDIMGNLTLTLTGALCLLMTALFLAWFLISRLTSPLSRLTAQMAIIASDPGRETAPVKAAGDETGLLADTFNQMMTVIRERDQRIARHMETLEDTVDERTRDLRLARDAAEAANAAKSDFLATMSHEIRTPMNGMMVMADMLAASDLPVRQRRYADIISRSGGSLLTIINDILDLSKIENGKLDLEHIPVSPEQLSLDAVSLFSERAREKGLDLTLCVSPKVPERVIADPTRLNQVITNLVNNALKFTEDGGVTINLAASDPLENGAVRLVFAVDDTGVGIPQDKLPHIFDAFSQADQTTTRRFGGTGLGLAVCKRLVDAMGGRITVKSRVGKGSQFRFDVTVPIEVCAPKTADLPIKATVECDTPLLRRSLVFALNAQGCGLAERPEEASFRIVPSHRAATSRSQVPTVILADIGDIYADQVLADGRADDMLSLPISRSDVRELLKRAASGRFRGPTAHQECDEMPALPNLAGLHVLAVDDNAVNREVLREALSGIKVSADFAENGVEALKALELGDYDLVLMDGAMPVMDGFEATRRIRVREAEARLDRVPVIALTAQVAGTSEADWTEAGADGFVSKPFTIERLAAVLAGNVDVSAIEPKDLEQQPASGQPLFDAETLAQFEALGGASKHRVRDTVWTMFVERAPAGLEDLRKAMNGEASTDECASLAHALKSMALSAGASRIAAIAGEMEGQLKAGQTDRASGHLPDLEWAYRDTLTAMEHEMSAASVGSDQHCLDIQAT